MPDDPTALARDIRKQVANTERVTALQENVELSLGEAASVLGLSGPLVV